MDKDNTIPAVWRPLSTAKHDGTPYIAMHISEGSPDYPPSHLCWLENGLYGARWYFLHTGSAKSIVNEEGGYWIESVAECLEAAQATEGGNG